MFFDLHFNISLITFRETKNDFINFETYLTNSIKKALFISANQFIRGAFLLHFNNFTAFFVKSSKLIIF